MFFTAFLSHSSILAKKHLDEVAVNFQLYSYSREEQNNPFDNINTRMDLIYV